MNIPASDMPDRRGPDTPPRRDPTFPTLLALAVLVPIALLLAGGWFGWHDIRRQAATELTGAAGAAARVAARLLDSQSRVADRIDDLLARLSDTEIRGGEARLRAAVQELAPAGDMVAGVLVVDAGGQPLLTLGTGLEAAGAALLAALRAPDAPPVAIGALDEAGSAGERLVGVALRRDRASPSPFRGAVILLLRPAAIAERLREIAGAPEDALALLSLQGAVLARSGGEGAGGGAVLAAEALWEADGATRDRPRGLDGEPATAALHRVAGWPVLALAERPQRAIVARWRVIALWQAGFGIPAALVLLGLALLAWRHAGDAAAARKIEASRREGASHLRQVLATFDLGAFMARRPDGTITSWSAGCERLYGWRAEEALGRVSHELLGTVFPEPPAAIAAALERDGEWNGLLRQRNRAGEEVAVAVQKSLQRDDTGVPGTILESLVDVSGQQRAEAQLRSILETVPDAMIVIDERGVMTSFSTAAERLFGWTAAEAIGRNVSILMPNPDRARHDTYLSRYLATGERHVIGVGREVTGQRRDGTTFPMELSVGEVNTGAHRLFTGFVRDLSERQEHQQRLQSVQSELLHVSRLSAAGEMASALAHELNQPLTAIASSVRAALRMLQDMPDSEAIPPRMVEAMERAAGQSLRAGQIVRRLREFVLKGEVERQLVELTPLVEEAASLALVGARQLGVHVTFRLDPGPMAVMVAPIQIQQVLLNLIRNAIDAMTETPAANARREMVISTARPDATSIEVAVADTGPGLAPEVAAKLFEPFITTKAGGMGVGLSISRSIIETHGGRLWAQPNPVGGTIFRFTLPAGAAISGDQPS